MTSLQLWISTDGGTNWQPLHASSKGGGTYQASYTVPRLDKTNGHVSLKATALDAAGNDVTQTIINAYRLTDGSHTPN